MPDVPSALSLESVSTGAAVNSSPLRNNFSAIQTAVNALSAALSGGTSGQVLTATDSDTVAFATNSTVSYRKTNVKTVNTTTSETDLLNGEITIAANALGTTGCARIRVNGDWKQNSGGAADIPRFKLKLGSTTILDLNIGGANVAANSSTRYTWSFDIAIFNSAAAVQWVSLTGRIGFGAGSLAPANAAFTTGEGSLFQQASLAGSGAINGFVFEGGAAAAKDTTGSLLLELTTTNASANANYEVELKNALVEIV